MSKEMTRRKGRKPLSPPPNLLDLGSWGRFYTVPGPENFRMPRPNKGRVGRINRQCLHCGSWFKTNRDEQLFCKPGCRTYNNRLKRAGVVRWLIEQGVPTFTALDLLDIQGMTEVARRLEALGLSWNGQSWEKEQ